MHSIEKEEPYVVRPSRWLRLTSALGLAIMMAVAATSFGLNEDRLWGLTGLALVLVLLAGVADLATGFVRIGERDLTIRSSFRTRSIPLIDIVSVGRGDGTPITLRLRSGERYRLPVWCDSGIGLWSRIRARVNHALTSEGHGSAAVEREE